MESRAAAAAVAAGLRVRAPSAVGVAEMRGRRILPPTSYETDS